jgi:hypothetical protein
MIPLRIAQSIGITDKIIHGEITLSFYDIILLPFLAPIIK